MSANNIIPSSLFTAFPLPPTHVPRPSGRLGFREDDDDVHNNEQSAYSTSDNTTTNANNNNNNNNSNNNNNNTHNSSDNHNPPRSIAVEQSWLARLFRVKPATSHICTVLSRKRARGEIARLLRDWRPHGIRDVEVDKARNLIFARVGDVNGGCLSILPNTTGFPTN